MSAILGWALIVIGIFSYIVAIWAFIQAQRQETKRDLPRFSNEDLKAISEILKQASNVLENFGKLSVPVQWALLGLANIVGGAYLLANTPF